MENLIRIDFEKGELVTPKKRYVLQTSLSMKKYIEFEKLQAQVAFGFTFQDIIDQDQHMVNLFNQQKPAEAATVVVNRKELMSVYKDEKKHAVLQICALYLIGEDEDPKEYREDKISENIQDWLDSGVDYQDFFQFVVNIVPGLLAVLKETSQTISKMGEMLEQTKRPGKK